MSIAAFNSAITPQPRLQTPTSSPEKEGTIFIVDHQATNVKTLEGMLHGAGYTDVHSTLDSREACALVNQIRPDLMLLDLAMPYLDGFAVMKQLQTEATGALPIVILADDEMPQTHRRALQKGAHDFLIRPLDETEVLLRVENRLKTRSRDLLIEQKVEERTQELEQEQIEMLQRLALAAEYRSDETGKHAQRVARIATLLAHQLGLDEADIELIARAAPLHDVGKIGVADAILLKPGRLTHEEFDAMKRHTIIGAQMLGGSSSPTLQMAEEIAFFHHERWDGQGYAGIAGEKIPMSGRIVSVAVVFDALTQKRPYKAAWPIEAAIEEIVAQSGRQFDPNVVEAFAHLDHADLVA